MMQLLDSGLVREMVSERDKQALAKAIETMNYRIESAILSGKSSLCVFDLMMANTWVAGEIIRAIEKAGHRYVNGDLVLSNGS